MDDAFFIEARPDGGWNLTLAGLPDLPLAVRGSWTRRFPRHQHPLPETTMLPEALGKGLQPAGPKTRPSLLIERMGPTASWPRANTRRYARLAATCATRIAKPRWTAGSPGVSYLGSSGRPSNSRGPSGRIEKAPHHERPDITINLEGLAKTSPFRWMKIARAKATCSFQADGLTAQRWQHGPEHGVTLLHRTQDVAIPGVLRHLATPLESPSGQALAPPCGPIHARTPALGSDVCAVHVSAAPYPDMINETQIIPARDGKPLGKEELDTCSLLNAPSRRAGQVALGPATGLLYFKQQGDRWWPPSSLMKTTPSSPSICPRSR
ncbi:MAG: hypothetical protein ACLSHC_10995 [Bilophila wadsworthia]